MIFALTLFLIFTLIIIKNIFKELKKNGWSCNTYFLIFFTLFYAISPIIYLLYKILGYYYLSYYKLANDELYILLISFLVIIFSYISYRFGYRLKPKNVYVFVKERRIIGKKTINLIFYFLFLISSISLLLYINGFGGFDRAVRNAGLVRSFNYIKSANNEDTSHTFFFRFIFLAIVPFVIFLYKKRFKNLIKFDYLVSLGVISCLIVLYIFLSPGRQRIVDFILIFVLSSLLLKKKFFEKKILIILILIFLFVPFYDYLTQGIFETEVDVKKISILESLINEFNFPFFGLIASLNYYGDFSYFNEFVTHIYGTFLPYSLNPFKDLDPINYKNTYYLTGIYDKFIPPGLIAYGFYSLGFIGVFLVSFTTGFFLKLIDNFFKLNIRINNGFVYFYSLIILLTLNWIRTGLPKNFFYYTVFVTIFLVLIISFKFKKIRLK